MRTSFHTVKQYDNTKHNFYYVHMFKKSVFSIKIVDPREFLTLWDHILVNEPNFLYFIPLAACKLQGRYLIELSTHGEIMVVQYSHLHLKMVILLTDAFIFENRKCFTVPHPLMHNLC